jgi:hypothetical protein
MPTTCALCRRRPPTERIADPEAVKQHHPVRENRGESPTVDRSLDRVRSTDRLDSDVRTSDRVRGQR